MLRVALIALALIAPPALAQDQGEALPLGLLEQMTAANDTIRADHTARGDDGQTAREVRHQARPQTDGPTTVDRALLAQGLQDNGWNVALREDGGLEVVTESEIASTEFDRRAAELMIMLNTAGWYYQGWMARIVVPK